jgi:hypothetical protein
VLSGTSAGAAFGAALHKTIAKALVPRPILALLNGLAVIGKPGSAGRRDLTTKNWELWPNGTIWSDLAPVPAGSVIKNPN